MAMLICLSEEEYNTVLFALLTAREVLADLEEYGSGELSDTEKELKDLLDDADKIIERVNRKKEE